uniref:Uncharacterized protein n=1 Tax=Nothobranchius furzeri TaxID=105023 RepID=A0A8C6LNW6_NOTFU
MMVQSVLSISWVCFLLFSIGAGFPARKVPYGAGSEYTTGGDTSSDAGSGYKSGGPRLGAGSKFTSGSAFSGFGSDSALDAGIAQMVAELMSLRPNRPYVQFPWNSDHIPLDMVEELPVYPSSHVVHSSSGYQRARDLRTDNKYTEETFSDIPMPEISGTGHQLHRKSK